MKKCIDALLSAVPLTLWGLHIFWLVPVLGEKSGCDKFLSAMAFFGISTAIMLCGEIIAVVRYVIARRPTLIPAMLLNASWLYYVKVLFWGPTFGNF